MITCKKIYTDIPFAHRQPLHDGHCAQIHGHNWNFEFEFACNKVDENGFVMDFGKLKFVKDILNEFDHAFVVPIYDVEMERWKELNRENLVNLVVVPDVSAEGLAEFLMKKVYSLVVDKTGARCWVSKVTVHEDSKNSASVTIREGM